MLTDFCVAALEEAIARHGRPEIFNTDQGSQFTSFAFTDVLRSNGIRISMDGKGRWMDNVFIERLWRSLKLLPRGSPVTTSSSRTRLPNHWWHLTSSGDWSTLRTAGGDGPNLRDLSQFHRHIHCILDPATGRIPRGCSVVRTA